MLLIWDLLVKYLPAGQLEKVGLIETRDNYFEYAGSMSQAPVLREGGMAKQEIRPRGQQQVEYVSRNGRPAGLDVLQSLVTEMLLAIGEKPGRNGLLKTPERVAKAFAFMTQGTTATSIIS